MMDRFLRLASIAMIVAGVAACDEDTATPEGDPSTVTVSVFVEDSAQSDGDGDDPIADATVTLEPTDGGEAITGTTNAEGIVIFTDVPAGPYTMTHSTATPITNAVLTSPAEQTVVAQFEGGETEAEIVYSYEPGSVTVQLFRDDNDNGTYEVDEDTTLAGFQLVLFQGNDTILTGTETARSEDVDSTGAFTFENVRQGQYTLLVRPIIGTEVAQTVIPVTVVAGEDSDVLVEFTGGEAIATIAQARALALGSSVTVEGVVTAGSGVYSSTNVYIQDATGGILLFTGSGGPATDLAMGDSVRVTGVTAAFREEAQIAGGAEMTIDILGTGAVPAPEVVTSTDVNAGEFQGELVTAMALTIDSVGAPFSGGNFNVRVSDAEGSFIVFFDLDAGITPDMVIEGETYNVTGIMTRFDDLFEIKPRSQADLVLTSNPGGVLDIGLARLLPNGQTTTIRGVVTAGSESYTPASFYIQDATGGITVFQGGRADTLDLAVGDSLEITGTLGTFSAERQIAGAGALVITDLGTGTVPEPVSIDAADVNAAKFQGSLATADSVEVVSVSVSGSGNITAIVRDDTGEFTVFGDVDTGLTAADIVEGNSYSITGVLASFQSGANPPLYQLKPRSPADVVALP